MNTEQQAQQLRLAATIIETGHPWELMGAEEWHPATKYPQVSPLARIFDGQEIRLVLATPPDGRPLHNPDNLTAEQVGAGYRLALPEEKLMCNYEYWLVSGGWKSGHGQGVASVLNPGASTRLPLSVPWPEAEKPDPYAELKAAQAEGKVIQVRPKVRTKDWHDEWQDCIPTWGDDYEYHTKPEAPFQLPPPPPGMKWHREDGWKEDDLPQGKRPLVLGEKLDIKEDEWKTKDSTWTKRLSRDGESIQDGRTYAPHRTTRPLIFIHAGKTWTWHRPGDPMPCAEGRQVDVITQKHVVENSWFSCIHDSSYWQWDANTKIIGWRYADDEKKIVPLGPEDVRPFTVIRRKGEAQTWHWRTVSYVDAVKVTCGNRGYEWNELASSYERNESLPLTGKWEANAWEPCSKQI